MPLHVAPLRTIMFRRQQHRTKPYKDIPDFFYITITELALDCGHIKTYRGPSVPGRRARCYQCPKF